MGCELCKGQGVLPDEQCACGRPAIFNSFSTGLGFCGVDVKCIDRRVTVAVKPVPPTQEELDDIERQEYMDEMYGGHMGFRGPRMNHIHGVRPGYRGGMN